MRLIFRTCVIALSLMLSACIYLVPPTSDLLRETVIKPADSRWTSEKALMITVNGMITDFSSNRLFYSQSNTAVQIRRRLDLALTDSSIHGIILRVNSPGGTVTASDIIYKAILNFKKKFKKEHGREIPVIAMFTSIAASGGYYIACAADEIVAHRSAITGSVGVIFQSYNLEKLFDMIGVGPVTFALGDKKDIMSPYRAMTAEERNIILEMVLESRLDFLKIVKKGRGDRIKPALLKKLNAYLDTGGKTKGVIAKKDVLTGSALDSRILSARVAKENGLVDTVGDFDKAIEVLKGKTKLKDIYVVTYDKLYRRTSDVYAKSGNIVPATELSSAANLLKELIKGNRPGLYYLWNPGGIILY